MGTLYLVRHGQASFGTADYDQLSDLGTRQCQALGTWFVQSGLRFEAALTGSLRRHKQSLAAIAAGHGDMPLPRVWPGLNEYDAEALIRAHHVGPLPTAALSDSPELVKAYFRLLRDALAAWTAGHTQPAGMPSWPDFVAGVAGALDHVRQHHQGNVLIVSSGGPIATAVAQVLGLAAEATIDLNLRIRNSAVTELAFSAKRHHLLSFNHLPHLHAPERAGWVTYA